MGDHDGGPLAGYGEEAPEYVGLGLGIERRGRLVEHDQGRVAHESSGDGDALPLAAGQFGAAGKFLGEKGVVAFRQLLGDGGGSALVGGALNDRLVSHPLGASQADIFAQRKGEAGVVLEHCG